MKTKIITWLVLASVVTAWAVTFAATDTNTWNTVSNLKHKFERWISESTSEFRMKWDKWERMWGERWEMGWMFGMMWAKTQLTDEEKTKLESMTDAEKQAFFEQKRTEAEAKVEAREAVIDKLLNWETLTDAEKVIAEEIKTQRAEAKKQREEMKTKQAEMKAKMDAIKPLLEKQKAWTALTDTEKAKIFDVMWSMKQGRWFGWERWNRWEVQNNQETPAQSE